MIEQFLKDVSKIWEVEFCKINNNWCFVIDKEEALTNKTENIYFLWWWIKWKRSSDKDIKNVSYIRFDIDVYKNAEEMYWYIPNDVDLEEIIIELKKDLENTYFSNWRYVVKSWKWIHLYFCWESIEIDSKLFSLWMKRLYKYFNSLFEEIQPHYNPDISCSNISRIMRLPWSINQKNLTKCEIKFFQDENIDLNIVKKFWKKEQIEIDKEKEEQIKKRVEEYQKKEQMNSLIYWKEYKDKKQELEVLFNKIDSIPAYIIAEKLVPFKLNKNWKNFDNEKKWFCWYYYVEDINAICNWWSRYFNWWDDTSCYSPSVLVKNFYDYSWGETLQWFKSNFKNLFIK